MAARIKEEFGLIALALLVSWALVAPAVGQSEASHTSSVFQIQNRAALVVLTYPQPNHAFMRVTADGQYAGFDYDLMSTFAQKLDVELQILAVDSFDDLIPRLLNGDGDIVASYFSVTPERAKLVQYSEPYFPVIQMVVTTKQSTIRSEKDLRGKVGIVIPGSTQEDRLRLVDGVDFLFIEESQETYSVLREGRADFALMDSASVLIELRDQTDFKVAFAFPEIEPYGFAAAPGSDLVSALDAHLRALKRTTYFYRLVRKSFGEEGVEVFKVSETD